MRPLLRLLGYSFLADQRMAYLQSIPGSALPKPAALLPLAATLLAGFWPAAIRYLGVGESRAGFDCFCCVALALLVFLFPEGLISRAERSFLVNLSIGRRTLRGFEFAHTFHVALYVGLPLSLPTGYVTYCASAKLREAAAAMASAWIGYYILLLIFATVFQLKLFQAGRIPVLLTNLMVVGCVILFGMFLLKEGRETISHFAAIPTPGRALTQVEQLLAGNTRDSVLLLLAVAALLTLSAVSHWRMCGQFPGSLYSDRLGSGSFLLARLLLLILPRPAAREFRLLATLFLIHLWRAPRFNLLFLVTVAFVWILGGVLPPPPDALGHVFTFATLTAISCATVYSLITFSYDNSATPLIYRLGASPVRCARAGLVLSTAAVCIILTPALFVSLSRGRDLAHFLVTALWLLLQTYCTHLLMHLVRTHVPFSYPATRIGTANLSISYFLIASGLTCVSPLILLRLPVQLQSPWTLIALLGGAILLLHPVLGRVSEKKLRYLYC